MNTLDNAPSAKILLNRFGSLKATLMLSPIVVEPNNDAMNCSRTKPNIREISVKKATMIPERNNVTVYVLSYLNAINVIPSSALLCGLVSCCHPADLISFVAWLGKPARCHPRESGDPEKITLILVQNTYFIK